MAILFFPGLPIVKDINIQNEFIACYLASLRLFPYLENVNNWTNFKLLGKANEM